MMLPSEVPVMTLSNATLFPQALLPLYIFEPRYRQMLADSLRTHRMFSVAMQKPGRTRETPCHVAGLGVIRVSVHHSDGTSHLILQGLSRVELQKPVQYKPYRIHCIRPLCGTVEDTVVVDALVTRVKDLVKERISHSHCPLPFPLMPHGNAGQSSKKSPEGKVTLKEVLAYLESLPDPSQVADLVSCALLPGAAQRQTILETVDIECRLRHLVHFLMAEIQRTRKDKPR